MNQAKRDKKEPKGITLVIPLYGATSVGKNGQIRARRGEERTSITPGRDDLDR